MEEEIKIKISVCRACSCTYEQEEDLKRDLEELKEKHLIITELIF